MKAVHIIYTRTLYHVLDLLPSKFVHQKSHYVDDLIWVKSLEGAGMT
jgi:hypothetical protein